MFSHQQKYQNRARLHTKDEKEPYSCNICRKSFTVPARLTRHYRTHTGEKPYQCEFCSKSFSVKENLSVHRRIHTKERPYKCDICDSAFEHSGKLHRHMRIHTGERPHKCSICSKTFIQSGQLVIHMRTHTGEKPYICKSCGKGFTCSKQLKVHTRTHTGEKPYTCDICGKSFGYNHVLKLHQVAHYGEKCYKCTICYETFNSKKLMESHIKNHSDSLITDYSTKNDFFKNTDDRSTLLICNYINNYEVPTNEKKKFNFAKTKNPHISMKIQKHNDKSGDIDFSELISDSDYFLHNTHNNHTLEQSLNESNDSSLRKMTINHSSPCSQEYILNDHNSDNSCLYEIQNNDIFTKTRLKTICLSNRNFIHSVDHDNDHIVQQPIDSIQIEPCEVFDATYHSEFNNQLYSDSLNYVVSSKRNNYSLPPRKRCRMILESMNTENLKLQTAARYHSVIRFANSEIANTIKDNTICLNS